MEKHTITAARQRSATVTRRRQTRVPARRRPVARSRQARWCITGHLMRGIVRPRLVIVTLCILGSLNLCLGLSHLLHTGPAQAAQAAPASTVTSASPTTRPVFSNAQRVPALYQGDPSLGWDSPAQYRTWWPSACSAVALTADLRGWGTQVGVGAVLDRLWNLGAISVEHGLTDAAALALVAESYSAQAETFRHWSTAQVASITAQGVPVLALLDDVHQQTPYPGFVVGHWLVVVRVSTGQVEVRDSSGYHIKELTPTLFHALFTGVAVVVWRGKLSLPER